MIVKRKLLLQSGMYVLILYLSYSILVIMDALHRQFFVTMSIAISSGIRRYLYMNFLIFYIF